MLYLRWSLPQGCPSRHFGENQLSPSSIGISPLPTTHPRLLQQTSVRPSTRSYPRFSLVMGSSPGFGSTARHSRRPLQTRFRSGSECSLSLPRHARSLAGSFSNRHAITHRSDSLGADGFRISFTPLAGVLFTVPSRYWFAIGRLGYLALEGGPPSFPRDFTCPAVLTVSTQSHGRVAYGTLTRSGRPFQQRSAAAVVSQLCGGAAAPPGGPFNPPVPSPAGYASTRV